MDKPATKRSGNYSYIPGVFQYSCGVAAEPGHEIVRIRFTSPVPLGHGFRRIADILGEAGRPLTAFCACELRSPEPFSEDGFRAFNEVYAGTLRDWDIFEGDSNPVARSNVCPEYDKPAEPGFHAFCYTAEREGAERTFVVAGSAEVPEGKSNYRDHIVASGDVSEEGLALKADYVIAEMERRMGAFGAGWADTTAIQVYSVCDIHPLLRRAYAARGMLSNGLIWHANRPPVAGLDYEMDCRRVLTERVVAV
jgi:hypothetical protein